MSVKDLAVAILRAAKLLVQLLEKELKKHK